MRKFLFKVSVSPVLAWGEKKKPVYVVSTDKKAATEYAEKYLRSAYKVKAVSVLAEQLGDCMYSGNFKE